MNRIRILTREEIRQVACPVCKAPPGSQCTEPSTGARRENHHKERVTAARRAASTERQSRDASDAVRRRVADRWLRP
jgi:hypothetical protein